MTSNLAEAVFMVKDVWNKLVMKSKNVDGFVYWKTEVHVLSSSLQFQLLHAFPGLQSDSWHGWVDHQAIRLSSSLFFVTRQYNTIQCVFLERRNVYAGWIQRRLGRLRYVLRVTDSCEQCGFQSWFEEGHAVHVNGAATLKARLPMLVWVRGKQ